MAARTDTVPAPAGRPAPAPGPPSAPSPVHRPTDAAPAAAPAGGRGGPGPSAPSAPSARSAAPTPSAAERQARATRRVVAMLVAVVVGAAATVVGFAADGVVRSAPEPPPAFGPGAVTVELGIEHSLFDAEVIHVVEGTRLRFVVDNGDPIGHELITGPEAIHVQHANGTHPRHDSVPGEVSVGPGATGVTTFTFDEPGEFEFACHLPGHYEYGMHGTVVVEPAPA